MVQKRTPKKELVKGGAKTGLRARKISPEVLFEQNKGLAFGAAKLFFQRYGSLCRSAGVAIEEINQEALIEFYRCCKRFVPRGVRLTTFAYNSIIFRLLNRVVTELRHKRKTVSLDAGVKSKSGKETPLWSTIGDKRVPRVSDPYLRAVLVSEVLSLKDTQRDKDIFIERFGLIDGKPKTLKFLGESFSVTRTRVGQIVSLILAKLRRKKNLLTIFESILG